MGNSNADAVLAAQALSKTKLAAAGWGCSLLAYCARDIFAVHMRPTAESTRWPPLHRQLWMYLMPQPACAWAEEAIMKIPNGIQNDLWYLAD